MVSRGVFYIVTAILFVIGIALMLYQHIVFEIPFLPGQQRTVWSVEAKVEFEPIESNAVTVNLALPGVQPGFSQIKQNTSSIGFGTSYITKDNAAYVQWTKRDPFGLQTLYYQADFLVDEDSKGSSMTVPELSKNVEPEPYATAMGEIASAAMSRSSSPFSYTVQVINELQRQKEIASLLYAKYSKAQLLTKILEIGQIPARVIKVLNLEDGRRNRGLNDKVAVFDKTNYEIFDPETGNSGLTANELIWVNHDGSILDVEGGQNARISFSMVSRSMPANTAGALKVAATRVLGDDIVSFSIDNLPIEEQSMFKSILLLPIGVIIVVFLRIIVGIKTSGTFMPVLIAMAFLQTSLTVGLIGFVSIVAIGLIVRSWLSHLNLLLVARISAVIITVIGIIGAIAFITYKIGLTEGIKVTFFPMIILSWTIERMSIIWEEEGYKEVFIQGGGSLFVAVCAYIAMSSLTIEHLTSNFIGIQFIILALVLLMGNYTGFRLSELKRFKPLADNINEYSNGDSTELESIRLKRERKELKHEKAKGFPSFKHSDNDNK